MIPYVSGFHGNDAVTDVEKLVIKSLANVSKEAKKKADNNARPLETVLLAIGELARLEIMIPNSASLSNSIIIVTVPFIQKTITACPKPIG